MFDIRTAASAADYERFAALVAEYTDWCRARHADDPWVVEAAFSQQSLDDELRSLPGVYGRPNGEIFLAVDGDGKVMGTCAYRRLSDEVCELKRLFVPQRFHGSGLGRALAKTAIAAAAADGYRWMRLDTIERMTEAIALYRSLGFRDCAPFHRYSDRLMASILFMERDLGEPTGGRA